MQFSSHLELGLPWSNDKPAIAATSSDVRFWPKADALHMSAFGGKADVPSAATAARVAPSRLGSLAPIGSHDFTSKALPVLGVGQPQH